MVACGTDSRGGSGGGIGGGVGGEGDGGWRPLGHDIRGLGFRV